MDAITKLMTRLRVWRDANARRKQALRNLHASRSRFSLESLEPRLLLSGTPIAVTQFTAEASGFTAQFNQAVDATVVNLYDTEIGTLGPADVTVVGTTEGPINGSLVVHNDQVTFVRSAGVFLPDVYTVTMRSATNGIKGVDGSNLDGNNDGTSGDDYVQGFTVGQVPSAIVRIGDFARGPAQSINPGSGFPVTLNDGSNVTDVRFSLVYDPALLKITEVLPGSSLPDGTQCEIDLTQTGVVSVHISSPPMAAGNVELIRLIAEVPANASYATSAVLDLNQVSVNDGAISSAGDDGIQVIAYFGDTSGNQRYSSLDGARALRVVAGLDSGFAPYPTIDPIIIADITGSSTLSSLDGTRILQEVVGLDRTEIPDIVPIILVGLVEDTGSSDSDLITSNPAVSGTLSDDGTITNFLAGLDDMLPGDFVNVTADMQGSSFVFTRERLEQILGAPLGDGVHTVHLVATDDSGIGPFFGGPSTSPVFDPNAPSPVFNPGAPSPIFNPGAPSPVLDPSVSGPAFDPGAPGPVFDESVSGNTSIVNLTFTLESIPPANFAAQQSQDVVTDVALQWNQLALEAIRITATDPPLSTSVLAMVSIAQSDTLSAIKGTPAYLIHQSLTGPVSVDVAVAVSSYTVLYAFFPSQRAVFDTALNDLLSTIPDGEAKTNALDLGSSIGIGVLAIRSSNGSDVFANYPGSLDLAGWLPTDPTFEVAEEPQWGDVTPIALTSPEEFPAPADAENASGDAQAEFRIEDGALQVLSLDGQEQLSITTDLTLNGTKDTANDSSSLVTRSFTPDTLLPSIVLGSILTGSTIDDSKLPIGLADPKFRNSRKMAGRSR